MGLRNRVHPVTSGSAEIRRVARQSDPFSFGSYETASLGCPSLLGFQCDFAREYAAPHHEDSYSCVEERPFRAASRLDLDWALAPAFFHARRPENPADGTLR